MVSQLWRLQFPAQVRRAVLPEAGGSVPGWLRGLAGIVGAFACIGIATGAFIVTSVPQCACLCPAFPFLYRHLSCWARVHFQHNLFLTNCSCNHCF